MYICNVTYKNLVNNSVKQLVIHNVNGIYEFDSCIHIRYVSDNVTKIKILHKFDTLVLRVVLTYNE